MPGSQTNEINTYYIASSLLNSRRKIIEPSPLPPQAIWTPIPRLDPRMIMFIDVMFVTRHARI